MNFTCGVIIELPPKIAHLVRRDNGLCPGEDRSSCTGPRGRDPCFTWIFLLTLTAKPQAGFMIPTKCVGKLRPRPLTRQAGEPG